MPGAERQGKAPLGWVIVIHGGGWQSVGPSVVATENNTVTFFTRLGWAVDNIDYRKGERSLPDVLGTYDALRQQVGRRTPICLVGHSAGGNLALLTAARRQSVACAISGAGPTDLVHLLHQRAYTPMPPQTAAYTPAWAYQHFVITSFGVDKTVLRKWSPARHARTIHAKLLLGASTFDELVPQQQMRQMRSAMNASHADGTIKTVLLAGADTPTGQFANFTHASITRKALHRWHRDERHLLTRMSRANGPLGGSL